MAISEKVQKSLLKVGAPIVGAYKAIPNFRKPVFTMSIVALKALFLVFLWTQYKYYENMSQGFSNVDEARRLSRVYLGVFIIVLIMALYLISWTKFSERQ